MCQINSLEDRNDDICQISIYIYIYIMPVARTFNRVAQLTLNKDTLAAHNVVFLSLQENPFFFFSHIDINIFFSFPTRHKCHQILKKLFKLKKKMHFMFPWMYYQGSSIY